MGEGHRYFIKMERIYGRELVDELIAKSRETKKFTVPELTDMIEYYEDLLSHGSS